MCYAFSLSRSHTLLRCQRIPWLHRWVPFTISSQPAMFGGHGSFGMEDIKFKVCHKTWNDHLIRGSLLVSFPHNKSSVCQVWWPLTLHKRRSLLLICHVTSYDFVVIWVPLIVSFHTANIGGHRLCAREEISFFVCHVTAHDFVVRDSYNIMGEFLSSLVTVLKILVIINLLEEDILSFQSLTWLHVGTWSEGRVTSWMSSPHHKSLPS